LQDSAFQAPVQGPRKTTTWADDVNREVNREVKVVSNADSPPDPKFRAYAREINKTLQAIIDHLDKGNIKGIGTLTPGEEVVLPPMPPPTHYAGGDMSLGSRQPTWVR
jgi:hypothetical protein